MSDLPPFGYSAKTALFLIELNLPREKALELLACLNADHEAWADRVRAVLPAPRQQDATAERKRAADRERQRHYRAHFEEWESLRARVFARDNYRCTYCGEKTDAPHCDHVHPVSRGGTNDIDNLATACSACNISKGSKSLAEWRGRQ